MLRLFLFCVIAVSASAGSVMSVTCAGVTTTDPMLASCSGPGQNGAQAQLFATTVIGTEIETDTFTQASNSSAQGMLTENVTLLVTSGPSNLYFRACISGTFGAMSGGSGGGTFTGNGANFVANGSNGTAPFADTCFAAPVYSGPPTDTLTAIPVGVAETYQLTLNASAFSNPPFGGTGDATFYAIQFYDQSGDLLSNVTFNISAASVPEPSYAILAPLLGLGLLLFKRRSFPNLFR